MNTTGPITVSGTLTGSATGPINAAGQTITTNAGGVLDLNGGTVTATTIDNNGLLKGIGTIIGNVNNPGTVSPGTSPGVINVVGNFTQTATGILNVELGGTTAGVGGYDRIAVTGNAILNGTLGITQFGAFFPAAADRFQIITTTGTDTGTFSTFTLAPAFAGIAINYQSTFTELFASNFIPNVGLAAAIVAAAAADASTKTTGIPLFTTDSRGLMCLVGDVELLFYPRGAPIRVP